MGAVVYWRSHEHKANKAYGLRTSLLSPPADDDKDAGKTKRIQIRFIIELYQAGICIDEDFFGILLRSLVGKVKGCVISI
jgi:hypothetical protein